MNATCSGIWFERTEGAKFWLYVLTDLKTRGVADIRFVCVDGLTGFGEAIEASFPNATVQTCLVHQVRSSMRRSREQQRSIGPRRSDAARGCESERDRRPDGAHDERVGEPSRELVNCLPSSAVRGDQQRR